MQIYMYIIIGKYIHTETRKSFHRDHESIQTIDYPLYQWTSIFSGIFSGIFHTYYTLRWPFVLHTFDILLYRFTNSSNIIMAVISGCN